MQNRREVWGGVRGKKHEKRWRWREAAAGKLAQTGWRLWKLSRTNVRGCAEDKEKGGERVKRCD